MSYLLIGFAIGYLIGCPLTALLACWYWEKLRERLAD